MISKCKRIASEALVRGPRGAAHLQIRRVKEQGDVAIGCCLARTHTRVSQLPDNSAGMLASQGGSREQLAHQRPRGGFLSLSATSSRDGGGMRSVGGEPANLRPQRAGAGQRKSSDSAPAVAVPTTRLRRVSCAPSPLPSVAGPLRPACPASGRSHCLGVSRRNIYCSTPRVTFSWKCHALSAQFGCGSINHLHQDCHQAGLSSLFSLYRTGSFT